jgi:hypothetical protein
MKKAQPLNPIEGEKLSQQDEVKGRLDDTRDYNTLGVHHNALIDHILKYCQ